MRRSGAVNVVPSGSPRVDGLAKVTGSAKYAMDLVLPGMLHTCGVRSPHPHARVLGVDTSKADQLPGVVVLTRDDLKGMRSHFGPVLKDQPVVVVDKVRYVGDLVAAVAAEDLTTAEAAAAMIEVEYEPLPAVTDPLMAMEPDAPLLHATSEGDLEQSLQESIQPGLDILQFGGGGNVFSSYHFESGDVKQGFAEADVIMEDTYTVPPIQHAHLEPHGAVAQWEDGRLLLHCSTQDPWAVKTELADLLQIPMSRVRVTVPYLGGGYGGKLYPHIEPVVALLARKAGRPVRWVLPQEDVFLTLTRHGSVVRIRTGATADGRLVARRVEVIYDGGAYAEISPRLAAQNGPVAAGPYRIPNVSVDCHTVYTCKPPAGAFRGFGVPQIAWAYESQMDDLARVLDLDPLELRLRHLYEEGDEYLTGEQLSGVGVRACLERAAAAIGWSADAVNQLAERDDIGGVARGRAVACCVKSTMTPSNSGATLRLDADGSLQVLTSGVEVGQGMTTVLAQIAAESLGLPLDRVRVAFPDTDATPFDHGTKSSRVTFTVGRAVQEAAGDLRTQLVAMAAGHLEVDPEDLEVAGGLLRVRGTERAMSIPDVFRASFGQPLGNLLAHSVVQTTGGLDPLTHKGKDSAFWMWGAAAAEVEVDLGTGKVRVVKLAGAVDAGRAINPPLCHLQTEGSLTMGLGSTLMEEMAFDGGYPLNASFANYAVPSIEDFPPVFESYLVEAPAPDGPFGAKGVGEAVLPSVAPAIGNAVANALAGQRVKELPITPERVLAALDRPGEAER